MSDEQPDYLTCEDCGDDQIESGDEYTRADKTVCTDCDDQYTTCGDCGDDLHHDDEHATIDGSVCESCFENYYSCEDCDDTVHGDHTVYIDSNSRTICENCRDNYYSYCDNCDEYYVSEDGCCDDSCECESPARTFMVRNGDEMLANDTTARVSLPAGFLSDEGVTEIANILRGIVLVADGYVRDSDGLAMRDESEDRRNYYLMTDEWYEAEKWSRIAYRFADEIGTEWQTGKGNFTKRLSRFAHQEAGLKIPADVLSKIGNVGRTHSLGVDVTVEFTRELNMSAAEFYHEDSCWWQSYYEGRCSLKSNGGIGLRTFGTESYPRYEYQIGPWATGLGRQYVEVGQVVNENVVTGRAWMMPVNQTESGEWVPTFNSTDAHGYIIFNGYGDLEGYAAARIVSQMYGMTYRKIGFENDPMYVNAGGYLVTDEARAENVMNNGGAINLYTDVHSSLYRREQAIAEAARTGMTVAVA